MVKLGVYNALPTCKNIYVYMIYVIGWASHQSGLGWVHLGPPVSPRLLTLSLWSIGLSYGGRGEVPEGHGVQRSAGQ